MSETADILRYAARIISERGLHTGPHFAHADGSLDICAAIYLAAYGKQPAEFETDEDYSTTLIELSYEARQAIKALSASLPTEPPTVESAPGYEEPSHLEHVSRWASTGQFPDEQPPTAAEVTDHLVRTADALDSPPQSLAA
uniref:DUF6197 family protein n=1 Tax=Streptomyces tubercidicus TaxID=47759 RepID=UPI0037DDC00D|nr:hypothetical protein OG690_38125 [Streptomyces tubercidicus]